MLDAGDAGNIEARREVGERMFDFFSNPVVKGEGLENILQSMMPRGWDLPSYAMIANQAYQGAATKSGTKRPADAFSTGFSKFLKRNPYYVEQEIARQIDTTGSFAKGLEQFYTFMDGNGFDIDDKDRFGKIVSILEEMIHKKGPDGKSLYTEDFIAYTNRLIADFHKIKNKTRQSALGGTNEARSKGTFRDFVRFAQDKDYKGKIYRPALEPPVSEPAPQAPAPQATTETNLNLPNVAGSAIANTVNLRAQQAGKRAAVNALKKIEQFFKSNNLLRSNEISTR
jgi:hypothetical protein